MRRDPTEFRERFLRWKNGELVYKDGLPHYDNGKDARKLEYHPEGDYYYGGNLFGKGNELVVKGSASPKLYMHPWKTENLLRKELTEEEWRQDSIAASNWPGGIESYKLHKYDLSKPLSPVDPVGEFVVSAKALGPILNPAAKYLFGGMGGAIKSYSADLIAKNKWARDLMFAKQFKKTIDNTQPYLENTYQNSLVQNVSNNNITPPTINFFDAKNKSRLVDDDGNVNIRNVVNLVKRIYEKYPNARGYKSIINSSGNLYDHTKAVVKSAQEMDLPKDVSRRELVESALIHDFGKILDSSISHDKATEKIIKDLMLVELGAISKSALDAASIHMDPGIAARSNLARGLHFADVARGGKLRDVLDKNPHLAYPINKPLISLNLDKDYRWLLKNIINPIIDRYGYELTPEERLLLGLPKYVEGDPQIPLDVDYYTARKAVLNIINKHRSFERTSHYPSESFEYNLKRLASEITGKPIEDLTDRDLFDVSAQYIKQHGTNSGTVGLNEYLSKAQLNPDEFQALYTSTRDATALHYARENSGKPFSMDIVRMNINDDPNWSLAELWANNEFPVIIPFGEKAGRLTNFRKYELPYILNTGKLDYSSQLSEIGKKYYRLSYIEAPDMPKYARPITTEPGKGGILLMKGYRNPNPEISQSRIDNVSEGVNDVLEQVLLNHVSPKIVTSSDGTKKVVSFSAYCKLRDNLNMLVNTIHHIKNEDISSIEPYRISSMLNNLYNIGAITKTLRRAAMLDFYKNKTHHQPIDAEFDLPFGFTYEDITLKGGYNPFKYTGDMKQMAKRLVNTYYKDIKSDNSKNAFYKKKKAEEIVKGKAAEELFEKQGISPNYSLESPDGYRVFTTEPDAIIEGQSNTFKGGSHYVIVGPRGSKQLNVVGKYDPTIEEVLNASGGSHSGQLVGQLRQLSRNFGAFVPTLFGTYLYYNKK